MLDKHTNDVKKSRGNLPKANTKSSRAKKNFCMFKSSKVYFLAPNLTEEKVGKLNIILANERFSFAYFGEAFVGICMCVGLFPGFF